MAEAPYRLGDVIHLAGCDDAAHTAVVSSVVATDAGDARRRWRLLCRWQHDGSFIDTPIYCGDAGDTYVTGELRMQRATPPLAADVPSGNP